MNNSLMPPRAWRIAPPAIGGRRGLLLIKIFWDSIFCRWRGLPDRAGGAGAPLPGASPARSAIPGARGGALLVRVPPSLVPCRPVRARAHRCIAPLTSIALKPPLHQRRFGGAHDRTPPPRHNRRQICPDGEGRAVRTLFFAYGRQEGHHVRTRPPRHGVPPAALRVPLRHPVRSMSA